jgi:hypothetical protein
MWSAILPMSSTVIGGALAQLGIRLHASRKSRSRNEAAASGGSFSSLARAVTQMVALHVFDRAKHVFLHANPERMRIVSQIEASLLQHLGLGNVRLPESRKNPPPSEG